MTAPSSVTLDIGDNGGIRAWMRGVQADVATEYLVHCVRNEIEPERAVNGLRMVLGVEPDLTDVCAVLDLLTEAIRAEDDPDGYYQACNDEPGSGGPDARTEWSLERAYVARLDARPLILGMVPA